MELIVVAGLVTGLGVWAYRSGKRTGSRKGYNAGRHDRRRRR